MCEANSNEEGNENKDYVDNIDKVIEEQKDILDRLS